MAADADQPPPTETPPPEPREPGARVPRDEIDPDLIKLARSRPKIGVITAAGIVVLCVYFLIRLTPDRRFAGEGAPVQTTAADILAGKLAEDSLVSVEAQPLMSQAIRAVNTRGDLGHRLTPARGTSDRLWIVFAGDGWERPSPGRYTARLRKLNDLPFADAARDFAQAHPRPVFAPVVAVRSGLASNKVTTVSGDTMDVRDSDRVAFDTIDPTMSTLVVTFTVETKEHGALLDIPAWTAELARRGIKATPIASPPPSDKPNEKAGQSDALLGQARFSVPIPNAELTRQLEAAKLWASRVEPVAKHYETTWGVLKASTPAGFVVDGTTIPDAQIDLVGIYLGRSIPSDAYALLTAEKPEDYWHVMPITIALLVIGLLFGWALIRAVRRDILPTRA